MSKEKINFDKVYSVYDSLFQAFHNFSDEEMQDNDIELDPVMLSLWTLFLSNSGWTEDEFWNEMEAQSTEEADPADDLDISNFNSKPSKMTLN